MYVNHQGPKATVRKLGDELLLIRADASVAIGTGHVMRCLALAQAWQDAGGGVTFAMVESTPSIEERLRGEGFGLDRIDGARGSGLDSGDLIALARTRAPSWVVVDGYEFGPGYQRLLKNERFKVVLIDDVGRPGSYSADVVLNQNIHAQEGLYPDREPYTRLLLGTKYALLRREFVSVYPPRDVPSIGRKLLVSMGGSDPDNVTGRVLEAMEQVAVADMEVAVVAGGSNPHLESVARSAAKSRHHCRILSNVTNMQEVISWADLAVSAAGTSCWEYCALGLPAALVSVAENQIVNAEALHAAGAARLVAGGSKFAIGEMAQLIARLANSPSERRALSRTAHDLVDGGGAGRVLSVLMGEDDS